MRISISDTDGRKDGFILMKRIVGDPNSIPKEAVLEHSIFIWLSFDLNATGR